MALDVSRREMDFTAEQSADTSLGSIREAIISNAPDQEIREGLFIEEGRFLGNPRLGKNRSPRETYKQLVVPTKYCVELMLLAHNCSFTGHLGMERTHERLKKSFLLAKYSK